MAGVLEELTVLDLSSLLSGPCCAVRLMDRDADVIPNKHPGEGVESAPTMLPSSSTRSLQLDLKAADARHSFRTLVDGADILIENFRSDTRCNVAPISLPQKLSRYPKSSQQRQAA
jgi:crotonobetainyl-CoA:carnitine CoA-transferase CaiB-like acyl-CoA transferase